MQLEILHKDHSPLSKHKTEVADLTVLGMEIKKTACTWFCHSRWLYKLVSILLLP